MRIAAALVALLTVAQAPSPHPETARVLTGHFKAGGPRSEYLPFEVSPGTESVTISYSYSGDDGASVIDPGLFEPGPLTLGTPAFRGYLRLHVYADNGSTVAITNPVYVAIH